jgi:hypothetical protein
LLPRDLALGECRVEMAGQLLECGQEGGRVREADLSHDVPVAPAGREEERSAREDAEEPAAGIEEI